MESRRRCIHTLPHKASFLAFSKDGKTLVSSSYHDNTVNLWDVNTGQLKKSWTGLISIALSEDGKTLAGSKQDDNTIELWDIKTGSLKKSLIGHSSRITFIAFNADGKDLVSRDSKTINLWNLNTGKLISNIASGLEQCLGSVFSPNGQILAIYNINGYKKDHLFYTSIILWDVKKGQEIRTINIEASTSFNIKVPIAFSHDGKTLFISFDQEETVYIGSPEGWDDYTARYNYTTLWNLATNKISKTFRSTHFCALSPDGRSFLGIQQEYHTSRHHESIRIIDVETGNKIRDFPGTTATLSQDGNILAIVSEGGEGLQLLDWSRGVSIATLIGRISKFALSPDGNIVAVVDDSTIKLWQKSTEPILKQQLHGNAYPELKHLESWLAAELWEDADLETVSVMQGFPYLDLNVLDQLWIHYSKGRYGFSRQKKIWDDIVLLDKKKRWQMNSRPLEDEDEFKLDVGWIEIDSHPHYHGANDQYTKIAWKRTKDGYYPRNVYQKKQLLEVFAKLNGVGRGG